MKNVRNGRSRILSGALHLFSTDGVSATTLTRLRQESGVSVGSFYHHFASKEHVFGVLYAESLRSYQDAFLAELRRHSGAREGIVAIVQFHMKWCFENADRARFLFTERAPGRDEPSGDEVHGLKKKLFTEVTEWWRSHLEAGVLRPVTATICYVLWLGPAQELCRLWFSGQLREPSRADISLLGEAAWQSLRQPAE